MGLFPAQSKFFAQALQSPSMVRLEARLCALDSGRFRPLFNRMVLLLKG
jgi:hypothetical protein